MAIAYCVLASGSKGNALWIRGGGVELLVDCGLSRREVGRRLGSVGSSLAALDAVVCTHAHSDHIGGVRTLARRDEVEVWGTGPTLSALEGQVPRSSLRELGADGARALGGLTVRTVPTPHDAAGSVAVVVSDHESAVGLVTDLGVVTRAVVRSFQKLDGLVLETNHDEQLLVTGPYPEALKRRIRSEVGHLSNGQGAALLARVLHPGLQHLTLAHLSETNNTPDHALAAVAPVLDAAGRRPVVAVAAQDRPGEVVRLERRRQGQLGLALW